MNNTLIKQKYYALFLIFISIVVCVWAYYPGLHGGYYLDDIVNIESNTLLKINSLAPSELWQAMMSDRSGHIPRVIPTFSFALNIYFANEIPFTLKLTNLIIHISCGICIILLIYLLLNQFKGNENTNRNVYWLATVVGVSWLLHPFNLTSVLYIVQRMTSLSTLFSIGTILCYTYFRHSQQKNTISWTKFISCTFLLGSLAIFSKEIAITIPLYLLLIEIFFFKFQAYSRRDSSIVKLGISTAILLPLLTVAAFLLSHPTWLHDIYATREFTLGQRLLTESRVVLWYMRMIIAPDLSNMGLLLDDFELSKSLTSPISTLFSLCAIFGVIVFIFITKRKFPIVAFGLSWYLVGHLLESTILPLEIAYEHRNYMPSIGLLLAIIWMLVHILQRTRILNYVAAILIVCWVSTLALTTHARAQHWNNPATLALYDVEHHPNSARANIYATAVYVNLALDAENENEKTEYAAKANEYISRAAQLDKIGASADIAKIIISSLLNNPIEEEFLYSLENKLLTRRLDSGTLNSIISLTDCQISGICKLTHHQYKVIIDSMINNQQIRSESRASLILIKGRYVIDKLGDFEIGERFIKEAIETDPKEVPYRFELVRLHVISGNYRQALSELNAVRSVDKFRIYKHTSDSWEKIILDKLNS